MPVEMERPESIVREEPHSGVYAELKQALQERDEARAVLTAYDGKIDAIIEENKALKEAIASAKTKGELQDVVSEHQRVMDEHIANMNTNGAEPPDAA